MPEPVVPSMSGKTCVVTGATSGIGAVTAEALARAGADLLIVGRNRGRCEATASKAREVSGKPAEFFVADLSSQAEVRRVAGEIRAKRSKIDVLVNNAGAMFDKRRETVEGVEMTWALNHLGYFLLTDLLREPLLAAGKARVVNVASEAHRMASGINFDDPEGKKSYGGFKLYGQSKLANILFTNELARRLAGTGVTANSLHPGVVATSFTTGKGALGFFLRQITRVFGIRAEAGARTSIYLATSPEVEGKTGGYYDKCKLKAPPKAALDAEAAARLWTLSEAMTGVAAGA